MVIDESGIVIRPWNWGLIGCPPIGYALAAFVHCYRMTGGASEWATPGCGELSAMDDRDPLRH